MTAPDVVVWVTANTPAGLALVTGRGHRRILDAEGYIRDGLAKWSEAGRGWVVALPVAHDLTAACELRHIPCRWREVGT